MHRPISMMVLVLAMMLGTLAVAQQAGAASTVTRGSARATDPSDIDAAESERAVVTLDGQVLFQVRSIPAYPAKERAQAVSKRIEAIAADKSVAAESLRVIEMEDRTRIMAGDSLVAGFVDADATAEGVSRQLMAERALIKIAAAIASYRNDRSPRVLLINTAYALRPSATHPSEPFMLDSLRSCDPLNSDGRRLMLHCRRFSAAPIRHWTKVQFTDFHLFDSRIEARTESNAPAI